MLYKLWEFIQLLLPYGLVLYMYRCNKSLPTTIKTRYGGGFKAVLITTDYGILFSNDKYIKNRAEALKKRKNQIESMNKQLLDELNSLTIDEREHLSEYFKD